LASKADRKDADERAVTKAKLALEAAQSKKNILVKYTKEKETKGLKAEVERARVDELAKFAA